ncbi:trypsin-like peptidase domain-containing protein, partial [Microbispora rosea]|uniref:trypsin-like peptidase domain-containing protein n=1 Tax=Microbispora rosea TaxID=58117 RepID=UPI0037CB5093
MSRTGPADRSWVAAIHLSEDDEGPIGSGLVIDERRVLTCAHVARPKGQSERPDLWVAFPMVEDGLPPRLRVRHRTYAQPGHLADLVVLQLDEETPPGVNPAPLRFPPGSEIRTRPWWAHGFPTGDPAGNTADGVVGETLGYGKLRLNSESRYHVEVGFSGAGLWSDDFRAVVGVVCQAHRNGDGQAISLCWANQRLEGEQLLELTKRLADQADEAALAAWGWELAKDPQAKSHWRPRARGVTRESEQGYRFRGRSAALRIVVDWLDREHSERKALVVTGSPGVGKSAVLGRIITTADRAIRSQLPVTDTAVKATVGSVACAVHAKGKTALEVAAEIARAANRASPDAVTDLATVVQLAVSEQSGTGFNVIIDALDEATTPSEARAIVTGIVLPLVQTCVNVRVVVGTRERDDGGDLIGTFGHGLQAINLDDAVYSKLEDLSDFALATLQLVGDERPGNPYAPGAVARPVADRIAVLAKGNFLIAGLMARTYGMYDTVAKTADQVNFPADIRWALDDYLGRLPALEGAQARTVLATLAFAEAPGFTADLWTTALRTLEGVDIEPDRLSRFARSSAANFLVESTASTAPVFRLFHQALSDSLVAGRAQFAERSADERRLTLAFLSYGTTVGWRRAPEYLLRSLASHASRGHAGDDLLSDSEYLLYANPQRIMVHSGIASSQAGWDRIRLLRLTSQAINADPWTRAAMFSVTEALEELGGVYRSLPGPLPYRAAWAAARPRREQMILEGHAGGVYGVCALTLDGRPHLATAGRDGTVRIWDAASGEQRHRLEGHAGGVYGVCALTLDGRPHLATAGRDRAVRIWDATSLYQRHVLEGHTGTVLGVCALTLDGRPHLATAGGDGTVRIWDAATEKQRHRLEGHTGAVYGVCALTLNGRPHLASTGHDRTVRIWDAFSGQQRHVLKGHHIGMVRGVCALTLDSRPHLATAGGDRTVRIWDAAT